MNEQIHTIPSEMTPPVIRTLKHFKFTLKNRKLHLQLWAMLLTDLHTKREEESGYKHNHRLNWVELLHSHTVPKVVIVACNIGGLVTPGKLGTNNKKDAPASHHRKNCATSPLIEALSRFFSLKNTWLFYIGSKTIWSLVLSPIDILIWFFSMSCLKICTHYLN